MIEPELVLQFLILLLDRPALMGETHERAQRRGRRQIHQVVFGPRFRSEIAFAQQPHFGREPSLPPVVRRRHPCGAEARAPGGVGPVAPRHESPVTTRLRRGPGTSLDRRGGWRQLRARAGAPLAGQYRRRHQPGCPQEHLEIGRHAQCVGELGAMQRPPQHGVVAKLGIADHRRDVEAGGSHLPPERQRELPFRAERHRVGNPRSRALGRCQPLLRQVELRAQQPSADAGPQRHRHRHLAIRRLAERAAVLPGDADRRRPLFGETRAVQNQHATTFRHDRAQSPPHHVGAPRRMRDEVLKRLIAARVAQSRPHRLHRLPTTVVEQARHIPTQRAALTLTREAIFELLQPCQQPTQPHRRCAIEHRDAAYRNCAESTMTSKVITRRLPNEFTNLTK